jgi:hypothetical protein
MAKYRNFSGLSSFKPESLRFYLQFTMKKLASILFLSTLFFLLSAHRPEEISRPVMGSFLGFNLMPGPNSGAVTFVVITPLPNTQPDIRFITRNEFIRLASGIIANEANPQKENFFAKYEVEDCGVYRDSIFKKTSFSCSSVDQVWKLRYKVGPYSNGPDTLGWANSLVPSVGQMSILKSYGISRLDDYCYGENAFHLLHDMQSYAWQSKYKGS